MRGKPAPDFFVVRWYDANAAPILAGKLTVIDFDDCGFGWYMYDFAASISFLEHEPDVPEWLDAWLDGYSTVAELSDEDIGMIPVFIMLRRMLLGRPNCQGSQRCPVAAPRYVRPR
jgi:Ser/Thr protein kinase RdoA (MazF antagonist)